MKRKISNSAAHDARTITEAFEEFYYEKKARGCSSSTMENYEIGLRYFMEFHQFNEETTLSSIKSTHIYKWINTMTEQGLRAASINTYVTDVRVFLYWCMDKDYIDAFKIDLVRHQEEPVKFFTDEEIEKLLERPRRNDTFAAWRNWTVVNWILGTGNRCATVCSLRLGDIDFIRGEITLPHTKNKKAQVIPLSPALASIMRDYIRTWRKDEPDEAPLFPNVGDEFLTTKAMRSSFYRYCKARGVEKTSIHGLRHSFAREWVKNNGNMFALQQILGHTSLNMTRRYVKLFSEDIKTDFEKFNPLDNIRRQSKRTQVIKRSN